MTLLNFQKEFRILRRSLAPSCTWYLFTINLKFTDCPLLHLPIPPGIDGKTEVAGIGDEATVIVCSVIREQYNDRMTHTKTKADDGSCIG